jgi:hypothetical protein
MNLFRLILLSAFLACIDSRAADPANLTQLSTTGPAISLTTELQRLRTADHLYLPQAYRLFRYSGFSRSGGNPDRADYLYKEGGWFVYADVEGPGVVARIWATHGDAWQDIRIELDGRVIYEGNAGGFFGMNRVPFVPPLCEERVTAAGPRTAEGEQGKVHRWGVSYVPLPFQKRFRYLQKKQVYTQIDVKRFAQGTLVNPFPETLTAQEIAEVTQTRVVWQRMNFLPESPSADRVERELQLPAGDGKSAQESAEIRFAGPGIIREIRLQTAGLARPVLEALTLHLRWDDATDDGVAVPLDVGLGSLQQRTLALGRDADGSQFIRFPMPFRRSASFRLSSRFVQPVSIRVQVISEEVAGIPTETMYLHGVANSGSFKAGHDHFAHPDVSSREFLYYNGYTAFDAQGPGQVVAYLDRFDCQPELDEHVFVDDERTFPDNAWNGTGHEDFFDMAWGHKPMTTPMASGGSEKFAEVNVKLFWNDPLTFRTALRFNWEWSYKLGLPPPRDAHFRSVVYWYSPAP